MLSPERAKRFLLATDYPIDKVVWKHNNAVNVPLGHPSGTGGTTVAIPHGLSFTPFPRMIYSPNNFYERYYAGSAPIFYSDTFSLWLPTAIAEVGADRTNVYVYFNCIDSDQRMWYRVVGLAPENPELVFGNSDPINQSEDAQPFLFNSDHNYQKIYNAGYSDYISNPATNAFSYIHGLGWVPTAHAFLENQSNGIIQEVGHQMGIIVDDHTAPLAATAKIDTNALTVSVDDGTGSGRTFRMHHRVYLDE